MTQQHWGSPAVAMRLLLFAALALLGILQAQASSTRDTPLRRYSQVSDVDIEVVSRSRRDDTMTKRSDRFISHDDKIRLSFRAFQQTFHLHLEPNELLVPEDGASVRYISQDAETGSYITRIETIMPRDVHAYHGVVVHSDYTNQRLLEDRVGLRRDVEQDTESEIGVMGKAALVLHDDGLDDSSPARFEGSFTWAGNHHTIQLPLNYHASRAKYDAPISKRALDEGLPIVHRTSDRMRRDEVEALGIRDDVSEISSAGCRADEYTFNQGMMKGLSPVSFFAAPSSGRFGRRVSSSLSHWYSEKEPFFKRSPASLPSINTLDSRAPAYSYEAALAKRQNDALGGSNNDSFVSHIGSTQGCPNANRVVYVGVASDCTFTGRFNNDTDVRIQILTLMNDVSNLYRSTFKVALGVVDIEVRDASACSASPSGNELWNRACDDNYSLDERLSDFSAWRGTQPANGTGLWHLLTACSQGAEVGTAWLGELCKTDATTSDGASVTGASVSAINSRQAQVMSHELLHSFGAIHDCVDGCTMSGQIARQSNGAVCCPRSSTQCDSDSQFIMAPVSETSTMTFSQCSIGNVCSLLGQGLDTSCINDPTKNARKILSLQSCGNGILEPGEECDAGTNGSACCTSSCKLRNGASCDPSTSECCTDSCTFASSSTVCREAVDPRCDQAEMCTGSSADCPTDLRKEDGTSCAAGGLTCASGHCTSRDLQCQTQSQADYTFTKACSPNADQSCSVSCENPSNAMSCLILQENFIDGTSCGYGGRCEGGECKPGSWQDRFKGWYANNLNIAIPVTILVAIAVLALLYGLIRCLCLPLFARARGRPVRGAMGPVAAKSSRPTSQVYPQYHQAPRHAPDASYHSYQGSRSGSDPSPTPLIQNVGGRSSGWVDPVRFNGPSHARQTHADI